MANPIGTNFQKILYVRHPSTGPLVKFHGRIFNAFSKPSSEDNCCEMWTRIALLVLAPFAYIVLGLDAVVAYPLAEPIDSSNQKRAITPISTISFWRALAYATNLRLKPTL